MKIEYRLTLKNGLSVMIGICVILLALIPLKVAPDRLSWLRWEIAVLVLAAVAVIGLFWQGNLQSRDDHEQLERNKRIDQSLAAIAPTEKQKEITPSNALMRNLPGASPRAFDSKEFFRTAFYSALNEVVATSFKMEAERVRPDNPAGFYLDILAVGSISFSYDRIWWPLYRSQLRALLDLNSHNGILPVADFQAFYEDGEREFPEEYKQLNISFENWLGYLVVNALILIHPSKMVEISLTGKDFLKYLLHEGRSEKAKRL